MEMEKKLQMLEKLREETTQNGSRLSGVCKVGKKEEKAPVSSFSIRLLLALLLFVGLFTLDASHNQNAKSIAAEFTRAVSVDFSNVLPYNQIVDWFFVST